MSTDISPPAVPGGLTRLTDWGVIRAAGPEARKFLHGQLTQDVESLQDQAARFAGYCSAKGRLLATFVMWSEGAEDVLLACSADLLPAVLKRLSMFVLRARCKLSDASAERPLWGLAGTAGAGFLGALAPGQAWGRADTSAGTAIRLPDAQAAGAPVPLWLWAGAEPQGLPSQHAVAWAGLEASSGVARVVAATVEQFVPQMVNLELVDGVNFKKGCYPGQEVVARSQYRGTTKRRAQVVRSASLLAPGQELFHDADPAQPAGMVVLAGQLSDGQAVALVELKLSALGLGSLHAGAADGPLLTLLPLPYPLPAEAA
jgi:hypothetical protein